MNKYGAVKINAFESTIRWFVGDINDFIKKYKLEEYDLSSDALGYTVIHKGRCYVYSNGEDVNNTIPHEAVHAISRMTESKGILFSNNNHEMLAYLIGYVSGKILDKINECK